MEKKKGVESRMVFFLFMRRRRKETGIKTRASAKSETKGCG